MTETIRWETMKIISITERFVIGICLTLCLGTIANSQTPKPVKKLDRKEKVMTKLAKGTFDVKVIPQAAEENIGDPSIGRLLMTKQFNGDLEGTGKGQMLGSQSETVQGSGGYVAMERVTGTLNGRKGSFTLQHLGTMQGGKFELNVSVVPDSGSGELTGISGKFKIIIEGAKHFYEFDYSIPQSK